MTTIPIVFCFDKRIILGASVAIKSLIDCAKEDTKYDIRIFHSDIPQKDQDALKQLTNASRHLMKFHFIDPKYFKDAPHNRHSWTEIVYYRFLTPEILTEYDKAIYSDVDVLFKSDLQELYNIDVSEYEAAAVASYTTKYLKDSNSKRYFEENKNTKNYMSGLILFNNKTMRDEKFLEKLKKTIKEFDKRLVLFDLDAFNIACDRIKDIPLNYCVFETFYEFTDITKTKEYASLKTIYSLDEILDAKNNTKIIHYAGELGKPWQRRWVPEYYKQYIAKLPKNLVKYTFRDWRKILFNNKAYPQQHFDVGIVNYFHSQNYGACLTAYALQEVIKSFGLQVAFVNEFKTRKKYKLSFGTEFVSKHLKLMPKFNDVKKAGELADIYISGSDQVFRPQYIKNKATRDKYLLNFVNKKAKKIAFSASFGIDEKEFNASKKSVIKDIKKALETFDYVSTREYEGVGICKNILNLYAEQIIDPVFLLNKEIFTNLANTNIEKKSNKIVVYVLDENPLYDSIYKKLSDKYNLELDKIAHKNLCVEDWLKSFIEAEYVITDSFHGTCFALLFNKPFISLVNKDRGTARFKTLSTLFETTQPFVDCIDNSDLIDFATLNWDNINNIIQTKKQIALNRLKKELHTKPKTYITQNCTGCGACYNACPKKAITMEENHEGFLYPVVNTNLCVNCGLCQKVCPTNTLKENLNTPKPIALASMADDEIRMSGVSSGGVAYVCSKYIVENNGYVAGAVYNKDFRIEHIISNQKDVIEKFKGSKYFQSNTNDVFAQTLKLLKENKQVFFTGTPCQIAALKSFLKTDYENLICADIICHGVPSYKNFKMWLINEIGNNLDNVLHVNFRDKINGWSSDLVLSVKTEKDTYYYPAKNNTFFTEFLRDLSLRKSCYSCPFQKIPRQGDITLGDFWKIDKYNSALNDKKGTSLILINNSKGEQFIEKIKPYLKTLEPVPLKVAIRGNKTLVSPTKLNKSRDEYLLNVNNQNQKELLKKYLKNKCNL